MINIKHFFLLCLTFRIKFCVFYCICWHLRHMHITHCTQAHTNRCNERRHTEWKPWLRMIGRLIRWIIVFVASLWGVFKTKSSNVVMVCGSAEWIVERCAHIVLAEKSSQTIEPKHKTQHMWRVFYVCAYAIRTHIHSTQVIETRAHSLFMYLFEYHVFLSCNLTVSSIEIYNRISRVLFFCFFCVFLYLLLSVCWI